VLKTDKVDMVVKYDRYGIDSLMLYGHTAQPLLSFMDVLNLNRGNFTVYFGSEKPLIRNL
jgi:hypothetical protein